MSGQFVSINPTSLPPPGLFSHSGFYNKMREMIRENTHPDVFSAKYAVVEPQRLGYTSLASHERSCSASLTANALRPFHHGKPKHKGVFPLHQTKHPHGKSGAKSLSYLGSYAFTRLVAFKDSSNTVVCLLDMIMPVR